MTRAHRIELLLLTLLAAAGGAALALRIGHWGWSWDALNHHVYLGLIAEQPRWDRDLVAASYQSYQYPYLYWPVYRIALMDGTGVVWAALWSGAQAALLLPPLWLLSRHLLPEAGLPRWEPPLLRAMACALAFANGVILAGLGLTANDLLAALPLLWGVALHVAKPESDRRAFLCAALLGVSIAFKWSNGLMVPLLAFWWWKPARPHLPPGRAAALAGGSIAGFTLAYLPWGVQLWRQTGNPFYPFFQALFGGY